ncbi:MAG: response regulator transcription factor [Deltaproteobacteria bacterium]|nr:response regulator transcription factor [Deltaproteobacteria bacterium]
MNLARNTIRAVVVDDEPLARDELTFLLDECGAVKVVGAARDAEAALALCAEQRPDVAFVDLRMPGPDGIALAEALRGRSPDLAVVVVSAHDDGAIRAYEADVLDYLLKPVRLDRLRATVERVRERAPTNAARGDEELTRLAVRRKGAYVVVDVADVIYFEVRDELVWAVTDNDRFALDLTLSAVEARVPAGFFRSHRGVLVRLEKIRSIEPSGAGKFGLLLDHPDEVRVPLARERVKLLREQIPFAG